MTELCPLCKIDLVETYEACADYDNACGCDAFFKCPQCGGAFVRNCPAHVGIQWGDTTRELTGPDPDAGAPLPH